MTSHSDSSISVDEPEERAQEAAPPCPVFVVGIMPRSGTNYLHRLLSLHPDCAVLHDSPVKEDYLLHHSDLLAEYADRLAWQWGHWGDATPARNELLNALGHGLRRFLAPEQSAPFVVTKTPSVRNVDVLFEALPEARFLLLIRDGRSVVASGMKGFGWNFENAAHEWAEAARGVLTFRNAHGEASDHHLLLRYEDLDADPKNTLTDIFEFLNLPTSRYDFSEALNLPVYGSSFTGEESDVTWEPRDKPKSFNSQTRWQEWSEDRHARFNWIARSELEALGYVPKEVSYRFFNPLQQRAAEVQYTLSQFPDRFRQALRSGIRSFVGTFRDPA